VQIAGWDVAIVIAKALSYAATLGAAGAIFFLAYCDSLLTSTQQSRIRGWIPSLSLAAAGSSVLKVMLLAGSMSGALADMLDTSFNAMILRAGEGGSIGMRLAGLCIACVALRVVPRGRVLAVFGAALAAASFAMTGHVHALPEHALLTAVLMLHLLCAAFWLGALMPLYQVASDGDLARCGAMATRFGNIAAWLVAALLAAGAALLWQLLDSVSSLWNSDYGRMVSAKILLVSCLLGCAALNKWHLVPGLLNNNQRAAAKLRRSIAVEILLATAILVITAAFTTLLGPKS
jgi:putative copper resistance protein D